ncbi:hypothetical protein [Mycobacteroides abscessus]|uniref:hypothetical protein n=1 Tax=Mycobacteroides abscessus TaxID=36809 RepID=UPI0009A7474C|nr:hypothetical protein [Mycobacteroides abscessus]SKT29643.1 Uncharacterised protein [Mycobacteroides abscessus subsp. bolletii]
MSIIPEPYDIAHYPYSATTGKNAHGNTIGGVTQTPTTRRAMAFYPRGERAADRVEPVAPEYVARHIAELTMLVKDPTVYKTQDQVDIHGARFDVVGMGADGDWRNGPWRKYSRMFGGEISLKRVG